MLTGNSFIGQFVHPVRGCGGGWGSIFILASCEFYFIREHENLVLDPSNVISIFRVDNACTEKSRMELQSLMQESNVTTESPYGPAVDSHKAPEVISKVIFLEINICLISLI